MDIASTRCAIRGHCGSKAPFGQQLPCPYDGPAQEVCVDSTCSFRALKFLLS